MLDGWELRGKVTATILRGSVLVEEGALVGRRDGGRFLLRRLAREVVEGPADRARTSVSRSSAAQPIA